MAARHAMHPQIGNDAFPSDARIRRETFTANIFRPEKIDPAAEPQQEVLARLQKRLGLFYQSVLKQP